MKKTLLLLLFAFTLNLSYGQSAFEDGTDNDVVMAQKELAKNLNVYPNPAIDYVGLNSVEGVEKITLYNVIGSQVKTFQVTEGEKYFIGDLNVGMYMVQIVGKNNKVITTLRLSKK